jgi:FkbM family methyltransferase
MSRARGLLERFQHRGDGAEPEDDKVDVPFLLETLDAMSPNKQLVFSERWAGTEVDLGNGVKVTARSKKEHRRFVRPIETEVLEWLRALRPGAVFYDIGANCGSLTFAAAAAHGDAVRIVAIEPGFANFESLTRNLSANGMLGYVIPLQVALLDHTRLEPINYYRSTGAGTSLHAVGRPLDHEDNEFRPVETQMVPAFSLDDLVELLSLPEPTHVKVDVDGIEGPVLEGATRTLARGKIEELLVEIVDHDRAGTRLAAIQRLLEPHGYALAETIGHNADDDRSFVADYLFRRGEASS